MVRAWSWTGVTAGGSSAERKEEPGGGKWYKAGVAVLVRLEAVEQPGWIKPGAGWYGVGWKATVGETAVPAVPSVSLVLSTWAGRAGGGVRRCAGQNTGGHGVT